LIREGDKLFTVGESAEHCWLSLKMGDRKTVLALQETNLGLNPLGFRGYLTQSTMGIFKLIFKFKEHKQKLKWVHFICNTLYLLTK
jgi:hypothetical protein